MQTRRRVSPRLAVLLTTFFLGPAAFAQAPASNDQGARAYSEYICFVMSEVSQGALAREEHQQCEQELAKAIAEAYPTLPAEERQKVDQMPVEWARLKAQWAGLDEAARNQLRVQWARELQTELQLGGTGNSGPPQQ